MSNQPGLDFRRLNKQPELCSSLSHQSEESNSPLSSKIDYASKVKGQLAQPESLGYPGSKSDHSDQAWSSSQSQSSYAFKNQSGTLFRNLGKLGLEDIRNAHNNLRNGQQASDLEKLVKTDNSNNTRHIFIKLPDIF